MLQLGCGTEPVRGLVVDDGERGTPGIVAIVGMGQREGRAHGRERQQHRRRHHAPAPTEPRKHRPFSVPAGSEGCQPEPAPHAGSRSTPIRAQSTPCSRPPRRITVDVRPADTFGRAVAREAAPVMYDVLIVGGGPAGLAAALTLGRARRRVLLCDAPLPRNAAAVQVHNFVTRDGTPPSEFRRIGRAQLAPYTTVEVRDVRVEEIGGGLDRFEIRLATGHVQARRVLLCTGMVDELPDIDGLRTYWGRSIFICPYCHAWEVQNRRFGFLAPSTDLLQFGLLLRGWTGDVVVLTDGRVEVPEEIRDRLATGGVRHDERRIRRLAGGEALERIEFADGESLPLDVLFVHPPQRQVDLVRRLGVALDDKGYVRVHEMQRETSIPGIHAAGDLLTPAQSAIFAAASGTQAAAALNRALTMQLALEGALA